MAFVVVYDACVLYPASIRDLNRIFDALADRVRIAHAKDCMRTRKVQEKHATQLDASEAHTFRGAGSVELPAPGLGSLNYDLYVRRLSQKHPNIQLIVEHVDSEVEAERAKRFVDGKLRAAGV
jgi:sugar phosphate isomerase/epimerase